MRNGKAADGRHSVNQHKSSPRYPEERRSATIAACSATRDEFINDLDEVLDVLTSQQRRSAESILRVTIYPSMSSLPDGLVSRQ